MVLCDLLGELSLLSHPPPPVFIEITIVFVSMESFVRMHNSPYVVLSIKIYYPEDIYPYEATYVAEVAQLT